MDYISEFDIRLEREMYYAGETLVGQVVLNTLENFKLRGEYNYFIVENLNIKQDFYNDI